MKNPNSCMHNLTGNKAKGQTQELPTQKNGLRGQHILSSQARAKICAQYQRWQNISANTYTGVAQIGGIQAICPSKKRRTGYGNKNAHSLG